MVRIAGTTAAPERTITYTVTVASVGGNGLFSVDLKASGTGIADRSGNALVGGYTAGDTYLLDSTAPIVAPSQAFSIPENMAAGFIIGQVRASDANRLASFRIASGNPNGYFTIDSDGVVRLSAAGAAPNAPSRDYETAPNLFTLDIIATDAAGLDSATQSITIQVLDAMENAGAPVFTTPTPVSLNDTRSYDTLTPASGTLQAGQNDAAGTLQPGRTIQYGDIATDDSKSPLIDTGKTRRHASHGTGDQVDIRYPSTAFDTNTFIRSGESWGANNFYYSPALAGQAYFGANTHNASNEEHRNHLHMGFGLGGR